MSTFSFYLMKGPSTVVLVALFVGVLVSMTSRSATAAVLSRNVALDATQGVFVTGSSSADAAVVPLSPVQTCLAASPFGSPDHTAGFRITASGGGQPPSISVPLLPSNVVVYGLSLTCFSLTYSKSSATANPFGCSTSATLAPTSVQIFATNASNSATLLEAFDMRNVLAGSFTSWSIWHDAPIAVSAVISWSAALPASCVVDVVVTFSVVTLLKDVAPSADMYPLPPTFTTPSSQVWINATLTNGDQVLGRNVASSATPPLSILAQRLPVSNSLNTAVGLDGFDLVLVRAPRLVSDNGTSSGAAVAVAAVDWCRSAMDMGADSVVLRSTMTRFGLSNVNWNMTVPALGGTVMGAPGGEGVYLWCSRATNRSGNRWLPLGTVTVRDILVVNSSYLTNSNRNTSSISSSDSSSSSRGDVAQVAYVNVTAWWNPPAADATAAWSVDVVRGSSAPASASVVGVDAAFAVFVNQSAASTPWSTVDCGAVAQAVMAAVTGRSTTNLSASNSFTVFTGDLAASTDGSNKLVWTAANLSQPLVTLKPNGATMVVGSDAPTMAALQSPPYRLAFCYGQSAPPTSPPTSPWWTSNTAAAAGDGRLWYLVDSLPNDLDTYTVDALRHIIGVSSAPTPTTTTTTTTAPIATTTPAPPTTPLPTVLHGCPVASQEARRAFAAASANYIVFVMTAYSTALQNQMVSALVNALCVDASSVSVYAYTNRTALLVMVTIADGTSYNGDDRMAAFVYDYFPTHTALWMGSLHVASCNVASFNPSAGSGSETGAFTQLIIGVAIAGIISVVVCLCGMLFLCCRRYRLLELWRQSAVSPEPLPLPVELQNQITVVAEHAEPDVVRQAGGVVASTLAEHRLQRLRTARRALSGSSDDSSGDDNVAVGATAAARGAVTGRVVVDSLRTPVRQPQPPPRVASPPPANLPPADDVYGFHSGAVGYLASEHSQQPDHTTNPNSNTPPPSPLPALRLHHGETVELK